jgi:toxin ParE1/3/4
VSEIITFHPAAEREMVQAAEYYERESISLANAFVAEVYSGLRSIQAHPEAMTIVAGTTRRKLLQRFPYTIIYSLAPRGIRVLAVAHLKLRPLYWAGRE